MVHARALSVFALVSVGFLCGSARAEIDLAALPADVRESIEQGQRYMAEADGRMGRAVGDAQRVFLGLPFGSVLREDGSAPESSLLQTGQRNTAAQGKSAVRAVAKHGDGTSAKGVRTSHGAGSAGALNHLHISVPADSATVKRGFTVSVSPGGHHHGGHHHDHEEEHDEEEHVEEEHEEEEEEHHHEQSVEEARRHRRPSPRKNADPVDRKARRNAARKLREMDLERGELKDEIKASDKAAVMEENLPQRKCIDMRCWHFGHSDYGYSDTHGVGRNPKRNGDDLDDDDDDDDTDIDDDSEEEQELEKRAGALPLRAKIAKLKATYGKLKSLLRSRVEDAKARYEALKSLPDAKGKAQAKKALTLWERLKRKGKGLLAKAKSKYVAARDSIRTKIHAKVAKVAGKLRGGLDRIGDAAQTLQDKFREDKRRVDEMREKVGREKAAYDALRRNLDPSSPAVKQEARKLERLRIGLGKAEIKWEDAQKGSEGAFRGSVGRVEKDYERLAEKEMAGARRRTTTTRRTTTRRTTVKRNDAADPGIEGGSKRLGAKLRNKLHRVEKEERRELRRAAGVPAAASSESTDATVDVADADAGAGAGSGSGSMWGNRRTGASAAGSSTTQTGKRSTMKKTTRKTTTTKKSTRTASAKSHGQQPNHQAAGGFGDFGDFGGWGGDSADGTVHAGSDEPDARPQGSNRLPELGPDHFLPSVVRTEANTLPSGIVSTPSNTLPNMPAPTRFNTFPAEGKVTGPNDGWAIPAFPENAGGLWKAPVPPMDPRPQGEPGTPAQREMMRVRAAELSLAMQGGGPGGGPAGSLVQGGFGGAGTHGVQQNGASGSGSGEPPACGFCKQLVAMMPDVGGATVMCSASTDQALCNGVSASVQLSFRHFTSGKTDTAAYVQAEAAFRAMAPRVCSMMCTAAAPAGSAH